MDFYLPRPFDEISALSNFPTATSPWKNSSFETRASIAPLIQLKVINKEREMPRIRRAKSRAQGSAKPMSRLDERLRRARILADDDDDDEPKRQRSQAQTERMLNDPRVHKKIVENLYEAYKTRVRLCLCLLVRVCARVRVFFYVFDRS